MSTFEACYKRCVLYEEVCHVKCLSIPQEVDGKVFISCAFFKQKDKDKIDWCMKCGGHLLKDEFNMCKQCINRG